MQSSFAPFILVELAQQVFAFDVRAAAGCAAPLDRVILVALLPFTQDIESTIGRIGLVLVVAEQVLDLVNVAPCGFLHHRRHSPSVESNVT